MMNRYAPFCLAALLLAAAVGAQETITRSASLSVDIAPDGRYVIDVAGDIWIVPAGGGEASALGLGAHTPRRPRWSPDGSRIAFLTFREQAQQIRVHDLESGTTREVSAANRFDITPAWHPDGERLVYASDRTGTGFDLWETDLPTGLHWRLSDRPGDETDPAWSASGRDLVYVHHDGETWSLILRPFGQPEEVLVSGPDRIATPSWRPDGSLIAFFVQQADRVMLNIVILSEPRLVRAYANGEHYFQAPVAWRDRQHMVFAAGGAIRERSFDAWSSRTVPFRARIEAAPAPVTERVRRTLPPVEEPAGRIVVRAARFWDGIGSQYQTDRDIVIDRGRITAIEPRGERPGTIVIDLGDLAIMPGLVDVAARLPENADAAIGPLLLAAGLTTIVAAHEDADRLNTLWSGKAMPGPRLLPAADWNVELISGLADAGTPGMDELLRSRQATLLGVTGPVVRRFTEPPVIDRGITGVVLGSRPNGLPAGIGLHAELRALVAAGLRPPQALRAGGVNAAAALGVDPALGRVALGAVADLVFIDGDPLKDVADAVNVVAVVRNGRFFSVAGLIEKTATPGSVE